MMNIPKHFAMFQLLHEREVLQRDVLCWLARQTNDTVNSFSSYIHGSHARAASPTLLHGEHFLNRPIGALLCVVRIRVPYGERPIKEPGSCLQRHQ